ncbi:HsdM family class I SAM-dependent methyltransferase [Bradyrhizobium sp. HKCCYLS3013]|uniref:HsdM family class I SAM-dependent methyltransferase n=1 Tax=Bradyrhizobium sp. HKCCYLS3013 TaxID=3420735 RepID=UPI003EB782EF
MEATKRKELGAYYTPSDLADLLADWAVTQPNQRILEPSIGEGALVRALAVRLDTRASDTIFGCEIDLSTFDKAAQSFPDLAKNFRNVDFLSQSPDDLGLFDAVVANPPFTRNHDLSAAVRKSLRAKPAFKGIVAGAPGLWVYFLLHALCFLKSGGRLAFVVPSAVEFADYAQPAVQELLKQFSAVKFARVPEAVNWEGEAQQRAILILATGYGHGPADLLERGEIDRDRVFRADVTSFEPFAVDSGSTLADHAVLEIGIVTGANDVFLLDQEVARASRIPSSELMPIISRARHAKGLSFTRSDGRDLARAGEKTLLLLPRNSLGPPGSPLRNYLRRISKQRRESVVWFSKRSPWWRVQIGRQCDAVFSYMNHIGPHLTLIETGVTCTNTLHRVTFKSRNLEVKRSICVAMLSTYTQLHAERIGRVYGGGVLKFELKDVKRLPIIVPQNSVDVAIFNRIDTAMRSGAPDKARALADEFVLPSVFGQEWRGAAEHMEGELTKLRALRRLGGKRRKLSNGT